MPPVTTVTVTDAESGQKLLQFLERRIARDGVTIPRGALQRWVRKGHVRVDGKRKKPFDRVQAGQSVRIPPYNAPGDEPGTPPKPPVNGKQPTPAKKLHCGLDIVHEDMELLVLAKPAGLTVHGGTGHEDSVVARLADRYAGADFLPSLIHRLDKNTSGLLLAAKTYPALRRLNELVASGAMGKHYLAWVEGTWPHRQTRTLEDRLEKQGMPGKQKMATGSGKEARCRVTPLKVEAQRSLLSIELLTGRTHQIRVQLASRGHAVIGDGKYGSHDDTGMLLHAYKVVLEGRTFTLAPAWAEPYAVSERSLHSSPS